MSEVLTERLEGVWAEMILLNSRGEDLEMKVWAEDELRKVDAEMELMRSLVVDALRDKMDDAALNLRCGRVEYESMLETSTLAERVRANNLPPEQTAIGRMMLEMKRLNAEEVMGRAAYDRAVYLQRNPPTVREEVLSDWVRLKTLLEEHSAPTLDTRIDSCHN